MITSPQNPITLPKEVSAEVEKVKKQLTISEQEVITLRKAKIAEEYSIRELLKQKEELQAQISNLQNTVASSSEKVVGLNNHNASLLLENNRLASKNEILKNDINDKKVLLDSNVLDLEVRESKVKIEESKIVIKNEELAKKEARIVEYNGKLKKVISEFYD